MRWWTYCCFPLGWLFALAFYRSQTVDVGFPDEVFQWPEAFLVTFVLGTLLGGLLWLPLTLLVHVVLPHHRRGAA